jgi:Fic family protein
MFEPKYEISDKVLKNIKRIAELTFELNNKRFSKIVLMQLSQRAREISAYASTSIEGNPLPLTEVREILKNKPAHVRDSEREVLNYNRSMIWLDEVIKDNKNSLNLKLILEIHKLVTKKLILLSKSGKLRQESVFVNDPRLNKTVYWPPDFEDVKDLLKDLLNFIDKNQTKIDPLILAGIFHKQFVIIHPFLDGNGRTVRLATKFLLSKMGLNTFRLFSFENYYNQNISKYFDFVGVKGNYYDVYKKIDFTPWLEYFTDGIVDELLRVSKILAKRNIRPENILKLYHQKILNYLKNHDFITDKIYSQLTDRAKPTRNQDFNQLIDLNLIERIGKGKATIYRLK